MDPKLMLLEYGLKEKEADIYLGLLQMGHGSAQDIAKKTGIYRQSTYDLLLKLEDKGLIKKTLENGTTIFIPQKPKHLLTLLEQKQKVVSDSLTALEEYCNSDDSIITEQFRGLNGIKMLYRELLDAKDTILVIQPKEPENLMKEHFIQNFFQKRIELGIPIKILRHDIHNDFQKKFATNKKQFREVRIYESLPDLDFQTIIYNNTLVFIDDVNQVAVKITHKMFVDSQKIFFTHLWNLAKVV